MEVADVERWVQALYPLGVADLGGSKFTSQHSRIEQLNLLAHNAATTNSDNFVLSSLLTHDKLPVILHLLLATEAWREQVLPEILGSLAALVEPPEQGGQGRGGHGSCMRAYFIMHHESVLCNLLEVLLYHDYAAQALGDGLIDLVDYCCRQVSALIFHQQKAKARSERKLRGASSNSSSSSSSSAAARTLSAEELVEMEEAEEDEESGFGGDGPLDSKSAAKLLERDAADPARAARRQLRCWRARIGVHAAVTSVTMLRYLSEYCVRLPLGVISRLMETHDVASLVVPLIENPPWVRRISKPAQNSAASLATQGDAAEDGVSNAAAIVTQAPKKPSTTVWQKYVDHKWVDVEPRDLLKLTRLEAQPWLTMHALLLEPDLRKKYPYDGARRSQTSRARKFLNEILLDQLPILADLQRFMDESTIRGVESAPEQRGGLLLEAIPAVHDEVQREALTARGTEEEEEEEKDRIDVTERNSSNASSSADSTLLTIEREKLGGSRGKVRRTWTWNRLGRYMLRHSLRSRIKTGTKIEPKNFPSTAFSDIWPDSDGDDDLKQLAGVYNEDTFEAATLGDPMCALCGKPAEKRCAKCHNEWYCSRECQVKAWKGHKELCMIVSRDMARTKE